MIRLREISSKAPSSPISQHICPFSTFYDSQSGRHMKAPGADGIRIHALPGYPQPFPPQITSYQVSPNQLLSPSSPPLPCYTLCRTHSDIENAFRSNLGCVLSAPSGSCATLEPLINLATQQASPHPLRAVIEHCWELKGGSSKNTRQYLVENDAGLLADAGVPIITLSDCLGASTEDTLREIVEYCFNLDIAGDAFLERLSIRLPPHLISAALEMKVTRFEVLQLPPQLS